MTLEGKPWRVKVANGDFYQALGYERRSMWRVPVADCINGDYISCQVYECINGMIPHPEDTFIDMTYPNQTELALLEKAGFSYDGCFIFREV